jgi:glutamyl/glutaminyl-tRNA synthetase
MAGTRHRSGSGAMQAARSVLADAGETMALLRQYHTQIKAGSIAYKWGKKLGSVKILEKAQLHYEDAWYTSAMITMAHAARPNYTPEITVEITSARIPVTITNDSRTGKATGRWAEHKLDRVNGRIERQKKRDMIASILRSHPGNQNQQD